jgi:hypothetical protein
VYVGIAAVAASHEAKRREEKKRGESKRKNFDFHMSTSFEFLCEAIIIVPRFCGWYAYRSKKERNRQDGVDFFLSLC